MQFAETRKCCNDASSGPRASPPCLLSLSGRCAALPLVVAIPRMAVEDDHVAAGQPLAPDEKAHWHGLHGTRMAYVTRMRPAGRVASKLYVRVPMDDIGDEAEKEPPPVCVGPWLAKDGEYKSQTGCILSRTLACNGKPQAQHLSRQTALQCNSQQLLKYVSSKTSGPLS